MSLDELAKQLEISKGLGQHEYARFRAMGYGQRSMDARRTEKVLRRRIRFVAGYSQCAGQPEQREVQLA